MIIFTIFYYLFHYLCSQARPSGLISFLLRLKLALPSVSCHSLYGIRRSDAHGALASFSLVHILRLVAG